MAEDRPSITIFLNYTDITEVDFDDDEGFPETATSICIQRNLLKSLPPSIAKFKDLVQIFLGYNYINYLPDEIGELRKLQVLDVSNNYLLELPQSLAELQSLTKLQISVNIFEEFPTVVCQLKNLQVLEATRNEFTSIPAEISRCTKLELLALDKNLLRHVPRSLSRLNNLQELSLCGNELRCIPHGIWKASQLEILNLDKNPLLTLPLSILKLTRCTLGLHSCFPFPENQPVEDFVGKNISLILPDEVTEICQVSQSSVPCLQELAARRITCYCTGSREEYRETLPLPEMWMERLVEPTGTCDHCLTEIFTSTFPLIIDKGSDRILFYGLFCSVRCVRNHRNKLTMKVVYPV